MHKGFTKMPVWCDAMEVAVAFFHLPVSLPKSENYALKSQIRWPAESISANIDELFGRFHKKIKHCD